MKMTVYLNWSVSSMPDLIDDDYEAEEIFYNQQILISNNYNGITISDLNSACTNNSIQYYYLGYNFFTDNKNVITNDMDDNDKIGMIFHRDYHRRKLYLNLREQELMAPVGDTVCKIVEKVNGYFGPTLGIEDMEF